MQRCRRAVRAHVKLAKNGGSKVESILDFTGIRSVARPSVYQCEYHDPSAKLSRTTKSKNIDKTSTTVPLNLLVEYSAVQSFFLSGYRSIV